MHVIRRRGWEIPERDATPEHLFLNRRAFLAGDRRRRAVAVAGACRGAARHRPAGPEPNLYPAKRNEKYMLDRPVTDEKINTNYNNFYEFGSTKPIARAAQALKLRPWPIKLDGMVEKEQVIGIDDLLAKMPLEERLYRCAASRPGRCRCRGRASRWRSWSRWRGRCRRRNIVRMETFHDPSTAPGQRQPGIRGPMWKG